MGIILTYCTTEFHSFSCFVKEPISSVMSYARSVRTTPNKKHIVVMARFEQKFCDSKNSVDVTYGDLPS